MLPPEGRAQMADQEDLLLLPRKQKEPAPMAEKIRRDCTSQEKVDTSGTPFSHTPYLFCTMAGSLGLQYLSLYWAGVR